MKVILPSKYSKKWVGVLLIYTVVVFALLYLSLSVVLNRNYDTLGIARLLLLAGIISLVQCLLGFFGARTAFAVSTISLLVGIGTMIITFLGRSTGWEDLAGVALFMEITVIGLILGAILQLIVYLIRRKKS